MGGVADFMTGNDVSVQAADGGPAQLAPVMIQNNFGDANYTDPQAAAELTTSAPGFDPAAQATSTTKFEF